MSERRVAFDKLLSKASQELHADNPGAMSSPDLLATKNVIDEGRPPALLRWLGRELIRLERGGKFNTYDRPTPGGRWSLLSKSKQGGWYNAEYLPQLAAYVDAILNLGYPKDRVFFELPPAALQLDLAILDDDGRVVVLGEAKREVGMLMKLVAAVEARFADAPPTEDTKKRGDEARQLAWRLWKVRPSVCWLIAPGERVAFQCDHEPLRLTRIGSLPAAAERGLAERPPHRLEVPALA